MRNSSRPLTKPPRRFVTRALCAILATTTGSHPATDRAYLASFFPTIDGAA